MTPIEKVRSYVHRYLTDAYIIDSGWNRWRVHGTREQKARVAKKAIKEGMEIQTETFITEYGESIREMCLTY